MKSFMSYLTFIILSLAICNVSFADTYVRGYYRSNGTYVKPHYRSSPDGNKYNNWSTKGNVNPYTGKLGTKSPSNDGYTNKQINGGYRFKETHTQPQLSSSLNDGIYDNRIIRSNDELSAGSFGSESLNYDNSDF